MMTLADLAHRVGHVSPNQKHRLDEEINRTGAMLTRLLQSLAARGNFRHHPP